MPGELPSSDSPDALASSVYAMFKSYSLLFPCFAVPALAVIIPSGKNATSELAKRTTQQAQQSQGGEQGGATHSEEAVKGANHDKSPEQLQKETAGKA